MSAKTIPTPRQLDFMDWEFGVFFHFGIRSFFTDHSDWDGKPMPASAFNPTQLDCGQWARAARQAGAAYAILVCKHHDGFANWPTAYSDYSVKNTPWKGGKGDVVREFVDACRAYGLKVGLYYSPAQWGGKVNFKEEKEYDDYFIGQISELLTGYGTIDYLWFDGCGSEGHEYDKPRIIAAIRGMQPGIRIFNMWDPDSRWVGNEDGYAPMDNWNPVEDVDFSMLATEKEKLARTRFLPSECDFKLRSTWFDGGEANLDTIKDVEELVGIYEYSVGRGANFLVNIGPDSRGLLPEQDEKRLLEFGEAIRRRYGAPLAQFGEPVQEDERTWRVVSAGEPVLVNRAILMEDLAAGQSIRAFEIWASLPCYNSKSICVYRGGTVGHKAICLFPTIRTGGLTVKITDAEGACRLSSLQACYAHQEV